MSCCSDQNKQPQPQPQSQHALGQKRPSSASTASDLSISPKMRKLLGPATGDATLCADARDPVSLQEIWRANAAGEREAAEEIELLFSYEETDTAGRVFVRGFALETVAKLLERASSSQAIRHPVSGQVVPTEALDRARTLIAQQGISGERLDFGSVDVAELTDEKMRFFALEVFQLLASIDVRVDERIFMTLSPERLTRLALETREMLEANLPKFLLDAINSTGKGRPFTPLPKIPSSNCLRQFVLRETRRIFLTTKTLVEEINAPGHLHLLAYVFVGALAAVCPEIRKSFQTSLVLSFDLRDFDEDEDEDGSPSHADSSSSSGDEADASASSPPSR